ncbi:MAG: tRNA lysidine(34) synthetase TilS, partial [Melioribacteraceae bacterium]|nr:tRNA lysidine(34) synthetase TilS [Melioribacteraceae bacterium]
FANSFTIRKWRNGDTFKPLGMDGTKKISDFLTEQKVKSGERKDQFVLVNKVNIVWVVGLRIDDRFKVTNKTKKVLKLWVK